MDAIFVNCKFPNSSISHKLEFTKVILFYARFEDRMGVQTRTSSKAELLSNEILSAEVLAAKHIQTSIEVL